MEAAIDGSNGNFHFHRQWKNPCTSVEASTNFHGSKRVSTNFLGNFHGSKHSFTDFHGSLYGGKLTSMDVSMEIGGNLHESRSNGSRWTLMEILWKQLEVCDTSASRWKYIGVYGSSWKLTPDVVVRVAIDGRNGRFHFPRQWKLLFTSVESTTTFHGSTSTSIYFQRTSVEVFGSFHGSEFTTIYFHGCFHGRFHGNFHGST